ncbi:hypothetical protein QUA40_27745 [Microcoleus sp. Pol11C3]|uniref:hypothetical protein n=1 Tax=Microcoleus sp. Pol11C3 TaxID=3055390 RepID=UPI002FD0C239
MLVQPSRAFCKITFFKALALGLSIAAICPEPLTALSVGEWRVAADSGVRSPIFNDNLTNQETGADRDRLRNLYSGSELDIDSKDPENNIREFDGWTETQAPESLAQLPHRGENRQEFPIPNPLPRNLPLLQKPAPPAPLLPAEQLFEVVGSTVFARNN